VKENVKIRMNTDVSRLIHNNYSLLYNNKQIQRFLFTIDCHLHVFWLHSFLTKDSNCFTKKLILLKKLGVVLPLTAVWNELYGHLWRLFFSQGSVCLTL